MSRDLPGKNAVAILEEEKAVVTVVVRQRPVSAGVCLLKSINEVAAYSLCVITRPIHL